MLIKITAAQLRAAGADESCAAYQKFVAQYGEGGVEVDWTVAKQLELLRDPVWRPYLFRLYERQIVSLWSMRGVDLRGAYLREANLGGADLRQTDLREAYLRQADLSEADLSEANLREANLGGANLGGTYLTGADLRQARYDEDTIWPAWFKPPA